MAARAVSRRRVGVNKDTSFTDLCHPEQRVFMICREEVTVGEWSERREPGFIVLAYLFVLNGLMGVVGDDDSVGC